MVTLTCKCGATTMTFKNLKKSDFPDGWETDCCKAAEAAPEPAPQPEPAKDPEPAKEPEKAPEPAKDESKEEPKADEPKDEEKADESKEDEKVTIPQKGPDKVVSKAKAASKKKDDKKEG